MEISYCWPILGFDDKFGCDCPIRNDVSVSGSQERDDRMPNLDEQGGIEYLSQRLREGLVIPAHPLALTADRKLDEKHQRALTRYYLAAGAGGLAVGVHTTQFAIREAKYGLLEPVLALASEEV